MYAIILKKYLLKFLKKAALAALGERVLAAATFGILEELADLSKTQVDDITVAEWKKKYYGQDS